MLLGRYVWLHPHPTLPLEGGGLNFPLPFDALRLICLDKAGVLPVVLPLPSERTAVRNLDEKCGKRGDTRCGFKRVEAGKA